MGISSHERVVREQTENFLASHPQAGVCLADYLQKLKSGHFSQDYVDAVVQKWAFPYDIYDAYAFLRVHELICTGSVVCADVDVHASPRADTEIDYHNNILSKGNGYFSGQFWGGLADKDGYYTWDEPIKFTKFKSIPTKDELQRRRVTVAPQRIPLEVGYTKGSRTLLHLLQEGGLARWPYNSQVIRLFVVPDKKALFKGL